MSINVVDKYKLDTSGNSDNATALATMQRDIAALESAGKPKPRLVFPEGIYSFSAWPNMAFHNLEMVAEGQTILKYTGTGDAVTFQGEEAPGGIGFGKRNIVFDGFKINPGVQAKDGLVLESIHASNFKVEVLGAGSIRNGIFNSAIVINYCVVTEIEPKITSLSNASGIGLGSGTYDCNGITLNLAQNNKSWPASAVRVINPIIEGVQTGIDCKNAFFCEFKGGTIEQCQIGVNMQGGYGNYFDHVEMEGNKVKDVVIGSDTNNNVFAYCGQGSSLNVSYSGLLSRFKNKVIKIGYFWA